jgi:hypothetical protein
MAKRNSRAPDSALAVYDGQTFLGSIAEAGASFTA